MASLRLLRRRGRAHGKPHEHAALARLRAPGMMSFDAGFNFAAKVDCCGGVMWLWHQKITPENQGLSCVKAATSTIAVADLPTNWRDHIEVVTHKRARVRVNGVTDANPDLFDHSTSAWQVVPLDGKHKAVIQALSESGYSTIWVADHHLLQTHTCALHQLMRERQAELGLLGPFETNSQGRDKGTPNCFLFPMLDGAWKVYRFSQGITEADLWTQDGEGWTTCYFNRLPDLATACKIHHGVEREKGGYVFESSEDAIQVVESLGHELVLDGVPDGRKVTLKAHRDGRLVTEVRRKKATGP